MTTEQKSGPESEEDKGRQGASNTPGSTDSAQSSASSNSPSGTSSPANIPGNSASGRGAEQSGSGITGSGGKSFVDELGVIDLRDPVLGSRGKLFSVAGRNSPVAEFTEEFLVLHPPQKPFDEAESAPSEEISLMMDDEGVLVNEVGERRKIKGARFNGHEIFYYWEQQPGTLKHYAVWFDQGKPRFLLIKGRRATTDII